jgi:hypothetical protein
MAGYLISVPGTSVIYGQLQPQGSYAQDDSLLFDLRWPIKSRGHRTMNNDETWTYTGGLWPSSTGFFQDPGTPHCLILERDQNGGLPSDFEPWAFGRGGSASAKFIMGTCKDQASTPLGGAVVQGFKTSDDRFIGETATDDHGQYELRCGQTPTDQHYLVAYYDSGTDLAGTTVNTLIPTWRDGST